MRFLETTKKWLFITLLLWFLAIGVHLTAQTFFFTSSYFHPPNLYDIFPRIDQVTHTLSSMAIVSTILNLNLPLSFRKKWFVSLFTGVILFGLGWEITEWVTAPFWGWISISLTDTLLDLFQDFLGACVVILFYDKTVLVPKDIEWLLKCPS